MSSRFRPSTTRDAMVLSVLAAGAAFSVYQVGSRLFACGRDLAGWEIFVWLAAAALQSTLFALASTVSQVRSTYRLTQYLALPFAAIALGQIAVAYPRIFVWAAIFTAAYWGLFRARLPLLGPRTAPPPSAGLVAAAAESCIFLLVTLLIHSVLAFLVLHIPDTPLSNPAFMGIAVLSTTVAGWIVSREARFSRLSIGDLPPLALLAVALLRAKYPDNAYDSLFYKATLPLTIADWRTALTGLMDHTLLGTNLQEFVNSQLRILDRDYQPALISSLAFIALWVLTPYAARAVLPRAFTWNLAVLLLVSLTEPLIAAGTAYHEPMLSLLMVGALLPFSAAWLFLGAAIASKITAAFIIPIVVLLRLFGGGGGAAPVSLAAAPWRGPVALARWTFLPVGGHRAVLGVCLILAAVAVTEQFGRNLVHTGRILGVSEMLASLTDPEGDVLASQASDPLFDVVSSRGAREKYGNTLIHVLTLDRWIVPDELGFHIMPTSRLIAVAAVLSLVAFAFESLRRRKRLITLFGVWLLCAAALLNFFSQGRHLFPLSFAAVFVVVCLVAIIAEEALAAGNRTLAGMICLVAGVLAVGDQLVGSLINNGWECRRKLLASPEPTNLDRPQTPLEQRLADLAREYRIRQPSGIPPTILCEASLERMRYLGTHYVYAYASSSLTPRRIAANPSLGALLPTSILAVCFTDPAFPDQIIPPPHRREFVDAAAVGPVRILVSRKLLGGARATSMVVGGSNFFSWFSLNRSASDFLATWDRGILNDYSLVDSPGGRGSYLTEFDRRKIAVLISPFEVAFDAVEFGKGAHLVLEFAMPYSNSDGMSVEVTLESKDGKRGSETLDLQSKPKDSATLVWERRVVPLPQGFVGQGSVKFSAKSPSGNGTADWVYFRELRLRSD